MAADQAIGVEVIGVRLINPTVIIYRQKTRNSEQNIV